MKRPVSVKTLLEKKQDVFEFDGLYRQVFGSPEKNGIWLIYGREKNGKTWFALKVAEYLSRFAKVLYISAEEGAGPNFQNACKRAKLDHANNQMQFVEYISIKDLQKLLKRRYAPRVVVIDNASVYGSELKGSDVVKLMRNERVLYILLAHERKKEPDGATAVMARKMAKVIMRVEGLTAQVSGRAPGGMVSVDEEKAMLYWGGEG